MIARNRMILLSLISAIGMAIASQSAVAAIDNGTLTIGHFPGGTCQQFFAGYYNGLGGSYSPTGLTGGRTLVDIIDSVFFMPCGIAPFSNVRVSGFSSDPGKNWLTSVTCNSVTNSGAAAGYSYTSGIASWSWNALFGFFPKSNGTVIGCSIMHN